MNDQAENTRWGSSREATGVVLLLVSALAFSTAGLFTRLAPVPLWPMVFWRNVFGCLGMVTVLAVHSDGVVSSLRRMGCRGWAAVVLLAFATLCYLAAFARTSVADIAIIYAMAPMLTAALAWITLGERPARRTLVAAGAALAGVTVTVAGAAVRGSAGGDVLALLMTAALSAVVVLARGATLPPTATAFAASSLAALAVLPPAFSGGAGLRVSGGDMMWLAVFGFVTMTIAAPTYLAGAARVPAGRAMLISSIELPLAPFWVWLAFGEVPPLLSLIGGGIVLVAVLSDIRNQA